MAKKSNASIETNTGKQTYSSRELIGRFLPYIKKYRGLLYLDLFFASLTTLCDIVLPMIMRRLTNSALGNSEALTVAILLKLVILYVLLRLVDAGANFFMQSQGHIMGVYIETDMRRDAFEHLQRLSATYYSNHKIGQIMGRITNDLFDVTEFAHHCPEEFFIAGIKMVVSFIILSGSSLSLTLMIFACLPIMFFVSVKINHWLRQTQKAQRVQVGELNAAIEESLLGERIVKAFTGEEEEKRKFEEGNIRFQTIKKRFYYAMATFGTSTRMFDGLMYTVVILGGGLFLIHDMISAGDLVAYILYVSTLIATIRRIVEFAEQFQRGMTGIERFIEIMDTPIEIKDAEGAGDIKVTDGGISFKGVNFEYPDDHNKVLHDFDLDVKAGENLAIVGASGGGKTTICNLIPRFYDVTSGCIDIDGQDISKVTLKSLRQSIGIVQQDVYLFSGTIRENIAYGRPGASDKEIEEAAIMAGADEFIDRLPNGMDTYIGERGVKLSGGQKQRISIARVFLKNPKILILDEATSALDNESELFVTKSLEKLAKGRTTITIAHRLTTIQNADRIIVLGKEGILEEGTHEMLLNRQGMYYKLWNRMAALD
ncbi:ATP-binding cassette, subfamily B [Butyrivibrio fibrisolvens DSM 3071]|uniref:ATP-binding cassette, subfamily B n=1 Tax=Butyrivibrio fibrisolvens DSM 3071 TaxID=1121131 RepID=A0A1M5ZM49_BUTFI|nr:ABC transporter ATP-binding protein [Butyrivibrio fibrisolvens]SHI25246.1 ATP-binding cassette, subfamily B [Butyrivibrio fibrisolvens DSM 3071]